MIDLNALQITTFEAPRTTRLLEDAGLTRIGGAIVERHEDGDPRQVIVELTWLGRLVSAVHTAPSKWLAGQRGHAAVEQH